MASPAPHANVAALHSAVSRWIGEAAGRPNAAELLWSRVEWLEGQSAILTAPGKTPAHLEGVGAFDLTVAISRLAGAAATAERRAAA